MRDMPHYLCDMTYSYVWHVHIHMHTQSQSNASSAFMSQHAHMLICMYVYTLIRETWLVLCDTWLIVCETWLIYTCDMTHWNMYHSFICMTCTYAYAYINNLAPQVPSCHSMHTYLFLSLYIYICIHINTWEMTHICKMWHIYTCDMTHSYVSLIRVYDVYIYICIHRLTSASSAFATALAPSPLPSGV